MTASNKYRFTVRLKQHTPIIHFQHDQPGATLRATEVKPKLDRFIIEKVTGKKDKQKAEESFKKSYSHWLVGGGKGEHVALDYKLRIKANGFPAKKICKKDRKIAPMYFGNMGDDYEKSPMGLSFYKSIDVSFFTFDSSLMELVKQHVSDFFACTNFGTRQTKGYGSFTVSDNEDVPSKAVYCITLDDKLLKHSMLSGCSSYKMKPLVAIEWFYKSLRQGINGYFCLERECKKWNPSFYMKPMLFLYAASKGVQWEKKTIKESFFNGNGGQLNKQQRKYSIQKKENSPLYYSSKNKFLVRDLFGLSSQESWYNNPYPKAKSVIIKEDVNGVIQRYPSPLVFKPVQKGKEVVIYIWWREYCEEYLSTSFYIMCEKDRCMCKKKIELSVWKDFNFNDFFSFVSTLWNEESVDFDVVCNANKPCCSLAGFLKALYRTLKLCKRK